MKEGLKSQNMVNEEHSENNLVQWKGAVAVTSGVRPPELNRNRVASTTNMQAASDLRQMLRSTGSPPERKQAPPPPPPNRDCKVTVVPVNTSEDDPGPFNFRQLLRKTNYAPTDTIRKRQLKRDGVNGYGAEYQM